MTDQFKYHQTLYNLDIKGNTRQWSITVTEGEDETATITTSQGIHGGKLTDRKTRVTKGKNVGKVNETTPVEQAIAEAESKVKNQIQKLGYQHSEPRSRFGLNGLGFLQPMAALERSKIKGVPDDEVAEFTPKLDGFRLMTDVGTIYTREGCLYENAEIARQVNILASEGYGGLDGELYCHGLTFQEIGSAAKKENANSHLLKLHVYDCPDWDIEVPFKARRVVKESLKRVIAKHNLDRICVVESVVATLAEWDDLHSKWVSQGYEGSIARRMGDVYLPGGRDKRMIKRKDYHDEEFEIIGIDRSIKPAPVVGPVDKYPEGSVADGYAKQAQLICVKDGKQFRASMEGGVLVRAKLYAARDFDFVGKLATCKYFEWTDDGLPRHPIARRRDEL